MIGGQCDAIYLKWAALLTGGACRDLDGLRALDRSAENLIATARETAKRADGDTIFPNPNRIDFNNDLTLYSRFSERLHASGFDYWTGDSGTAFPLPVILGPNPAGISIVTQFDAWQTKITAWRDYFRAITGQEPIGPDLPEPSANKGEGPDVFAKATNLLLIAGAIVLVVTLVKR
jgi:hypothetical protein